MKFLKFSTFETKNIDEFIEMAEERLDMQWEHNKEVFKYNYYMNYEDLNYYTSEFVKHDMSDTLDILDEFYCDEVIKAELHG